MTDTQKDRILGLRPVSDQEILTRWHIDTRTPRFGARTATPEELETSRESAQADADKWYQEGCNDGLQRFGVMSDDALILNYWHFHLRGEQSHSAYEQGMRDAFAILAQRRELTIPDPGQLTKPQRCVCGRCEVAYGWGAPS